MNSTRTLTHVDLFSGLGGFTHATEIANALADADRERRDGQPVRLQPMESQPAGVETARCRASGGTSDASFDRDKPYLRCECCGARHYGDTGEFCPACFAAECFAPAPADAELRGLESRPTGDAESDYACSHRFVTIAHSELEPFACEVYHRHYPESVCLGAIQNVCRDTIFERTGVAQVDLVTGGFPCQPHSAAGKRLASADDRDLWGECARVLRDLRPRYALFENVRGLLTSERGLFFNRVLSDLADSGYACLWQVLPASAVGAPHRRERVWLLCADEARLGDAAQSAVGRLAGGRVGAGPETDVARRTDHHELARPSADHGGDRVRAFPGWPAGPGEPQREWEYPRTTIGKIIAPLDCSTNGLPSAVGGVGEEVFWRTPSAEEAGAKVETLYTKDGQPARPGERAYRLQPDGRLVLQSVTINQQVAMVGGIHARGTWPEVTNRAAQLKALGNAIVPHAAAVFLLAILNDSETQP